MRINNNISALFAQNKLANTNNALAKSLEKLSSGLRINRAGDDAAGLAISEKMRGQIGGLNQAVRNAQDAISLIQTAEGALNETHSILQRMRELAVQAANDTNTSGDRKKIKDELSELVNELNRIASQTEFNTKKLLTGSFVGKFQIGANTGQNVKLSITTMNASALGVAASTFASIDNASVGQSVADNLIGKLTRQSAMYLMSVPSWAPTRTVWSIPFPTCRHLPRTCRLPSPGSVT